MRPPRPIPLGQLYREINQARGDVLQARILHEVGLESIASRKVDRLLDELSARLKTSTLSEV